MPDLLDTDGKLILVNGPARSGKSRWAESLLTSHKLVTYIATGANLPDDRKWQERIQIHKLRRPSNWELIETGLKFTEEIKNIPNSNSILIDSLGGYVSQHLEMEDKEWEIESNKFIAIIKNFSQTRIIVIEETGWGVVPESKVGGDFRDRLGELAQKLEKISDFSWLVIQGRAIDIHSLGVPVP